MSDNKQPDRKAQYEAAVEQAKTLFIQRNGEYGDAIRYGGVAGAVIELLGVVARLQQVMFTPEGRRLPTWRQAEILHDKLRDGLNYSVIAMMMLEEGNLWGAPIELEKGGAEAQQQLVAHQPIEKI